MSTNTEPATQPAVCVFDAYGTLFDVHAATRSHMDRLGDDAQGVSQVWRTKQLEYTWLRSLMGRYVDFWQVTTDALDFSLEQHGIDDPQTRQLLLDAYLQLDCYGEVPGVLRTLNEQGIRCAILSNGSPHMLASAVESAGLTELLDAVISVDPLGVFKPDPKVYELATTHFGVSANQISFQSSNAWDAVGAASFGFSVVWINRFGQPAERLDHRHTHELSDLDGLPGLFA